MRLITSGGVVGETTLRKKLGRMALGFAWLRRKRVASEAATSWTKGESYLRLVNREYLHALAMRWFEVGDVAQSDFEGLGDWARVVKRVPAGGTGQESGLFSDRLAALIQDRCVEYGDRRSQFRLMLREGLSGVGCEIPSFPVGTAEDQLAAVAMQNLADGVAMLLLDYEWDDGVLKMSLRGYLWQLKRFNRWAERVLEEAIEPGHVFMKNEPLGLREKIVSLEQWRAQNFPRLEEICESDQRGLREVFPELGVVLRGLIEELAGSAREFAMNQQARIKG